MTAVSENTINSNQRLFSLDAYRGFLMFWVIGGNFLMHSLYTADQNEIFLWLGWQLRHEVWDGINFFDTLFPSFMFVSGIALVFSISKSIERGMEKSVIVMKVSKRFLFLIILGIIYNNRLSFDFANIRYVSVLSKIGFGYFVTCILLLYGNLTWRIAIAVSILLAYWAAMTLIPVPGFDAGVLTPEANLAAYLDRLLLPGSMYREFYEPEGIMSTISASVCTIAGSLTGSFLLSKKNTSGKKLTILLVTGAALILLGRLWNPFYPVNKEIWSSSFNLIVIGMALITFVFFYYFIDIKGYSKYAFPLVVIGVNSITIYMIYRMVDFSYTAEFVLYGFIKLAGAWGEFVKMLGVLTLEWLLLYYFYKKKIFLKV